MDITLLGKSAALEVPATNTYPARTLVATICAQGPTRVVKVKKLQSPFQIIAQLEDMKKIPRTESKISKTKELPLYCIELNAPGFGLSM